MDLLTYLEENSEIDNEFIEDFFEMIDYNEYYINLDCVMKWNKIEDKEEYKKNFMENNKYKIENDKILLDLSVLKQIINEEHKKKIYELEILYNKYTKYRIKKLKKQIRLLKKNLKNNNKVVLNTIDSIQKLEPQENNTCSIDYKYNCSHIFNRLLLYILIVITIFRIISLIYYISYKNNNNCYSFISILNKVIFFILLGIIIIKIIMSLSSTIISFTQNNIKSNNI